ncbi:MATE family efflux transporter [Dielma fastidiosa]|uniref:MATE family efflux transporter n=1 Tax=Dielma fastidiosa TaxID=1034346 RepID=UPI003565AA33
MTHEKIEKQFWRYVLPSMLTMLLSGFYAIVDGYFVGNALKDAGLAAINIGWPIASFILAVSTGIGVGGSVLISTYRGAEDENASRQAKGNTLMLLCLFAILSITLIFISTPWLLRLFGAKGEVYDLAYEYLFVIVLGSSLQIFGTGCTPILRNSNRSIQAMLIMLFSLFTNIVLDAVLVPTMGMSGAALATVAAQGFSALFCLLLIFTDKKNPLKRSDFVLNKRMCKNIIRIGVSPFGLTFSPSIVIIFANWQCLNYGGEIAVAAYSALSYVLQATMELLHGIGEGVQPLISYCNGAGRHDLVRSLLRRARRLVMLLGISFGVLIVAFDSLIPVIFGASSEAGVMIESACLISSVAFFFAGLVKCYSSYFYAIRETRASTLLIYGDPLLLTPLLMLILPVFFDINGIWAVLPLTQIILCAAALLIDIKKENELKLEGKA